MKTLMTNTALIASVSLGGAALAQDNAGMLFRDAPAATDIQASNLIGMRVYAAEPTIDGSDWMMDESDGIQVDWQDVGEINDLVVTRDGTVSSVLVDIGGFLGIGERQIAMDMANIRFVADAQTEEANDFFLVIPAARADFEAAPEYGAMEMHQGDDPMMADAAYDETPLMAEDVAVLTTEDLTGARAYDSTGEWIGEISSLIVGDDGWINAAVVDVGGFLGIGEKPVELSFDEVQVNRLTDGDGFRVTLPMTEEQLEALPTYEG
jgi:sporulation protein YlmC with PRC-barrel domain